MPASFPRLSAGDISEINIGAAIVAAPTPTARKKVKGPNKSRAVIRDVEAGSSVDCMHCGDRVELPTDAPEYVPSGVPKSVEALIESIGYDVALSRSGPNAWEIKQGSATILICYHDKSGLISADTVLCELPKQNIKPLYEYLLRENFSNEGMTLSLNGQDIVLSLLIFDRYLNEDTGKEMLAKLFEKADFYDNLLVEKYGAVWKTKG